MLQRSFGQLGNGGTTRRWLARFFRFFVRTERFSCMYIR